MTRDNILLLSVTKEIQMLAFEAMDAAITNISVKLAADKAALETANTNLTNAQTELTHAQAAVDQRTAAIVAAVA